MTLINPASGDVKTVATTPACCAREVFELLRSLGYLPSDWLALAYERVRERNAALPEGVK